MIFHTSVSRILLSMILVIFLGSSLGDTLSQRSLSLAVTARLSSLVPDDDDFFNKKKKPFVVVQRHLSCKPFPIPESVYTRDESFTVSPITLSYLLRAPPLT